MIRFGGGALRFHAGAALVALIGCAKIGAPPGGPEDKIPPHLIATRPDSTAILPDFKGTVDFQFDETVSEGGTPSLGTGTSDLERLIIVSPTNDVPNVGWHRSRLSVRPKEGWQPNRVYRVQLLPGVQDIRNNKADTSIVLTFTTGAPLPTTTLSGRVLDWSGRKIAPGSLIEAIHQPDSLPYRALSDTSGKFRIGPLPPGPYLVFAVTDQNRNHKRESRELFDSVRVDQQTFEIPPLWIQPHDTLPPRIQTITPNDSASATVQFTGPLDPYGQPPFAGIRLVVLPDSAPVEGAQLLGHDADSLFRAQQRTADSVAKAAADTSQPKTDTTAKKPAPKPGATPRPQSNRPSTLRPINSKRLPEPDTAGVGALLASRPALEDRLILRIPGKFTAGGKYALVITSLRGLNSKPGDTRTGFTIPVPKPPKDSTKADSTRADTTKAGILPTTGDSAVQRARSRADSAHSRADTVKIKPPVRKPA